MRRVFLRVINYLDDFLVFGDSFEECQLAQKELIGILISLGFHIAWKKCSTPSTVTQYLGIIFDSIAMEMSLPEGKLCKLHQELSFFTNKTRATKRQLQRLVGILSHCAKVVRGGRTFSRRIIDKLGALPDGNPRVSLDFEFRQDILWWSEFAKVFNGTACVIDHNYGLGPTIFSDSSQSGYGFLIGDRWQAGYFNSSEFPVGYDKLCVHHGHWCNFMISTDNINVLELVPVYLAATAYGHEWTNQHVILYTDNTQVVSCINRGTSVNTSSMGMLRDIFWLSAVNNFHLTARHIRGCDNHIPDLLSRIDEYKDLCVLHGMLLCCS